MSKITKFIGAVLALCWMVSPVMAAGHSKPGWTLSAGESKVAFGSIKKGKIGEIHHFKSLSGKIGANGMVSVEIDLASVHTKIPIRNERMIKWVFDAAKAKATLSAKVDAKDLASLKAGDTKTVPVKGTLTLNGKAIAIKTTMFVAKLSDNKIMVTTDDMIMLSTAYAGINDGITKLMEIAKLPSIARTSPVILRLVFTK